MKKKEELNYFDSFMDNSNHALEASKKLKELVYNFSREKSKEVEEIVHNLEHEADKNQHKILNYLIKDFLPPIDREDIIRLAHRSDDVMDSIDEFVINLDILEVKELREDTRKFIDLLEQCCEDINELFELFKNMKKYKEIKDKVIEINRMEEEGDKLYYESMKHLYKNEKNPIEVIKWTTLYNCLEDCIDSCESVADCVEEILMKNS